MTGGGSGVEARMTKKRYVRPDLVDLEVQVAVAAVYQACGPGATHVGSCKTGTSPDSLCSTGNSARTPPGCNSGITPGSTGSFGTDPLLGP